MRRQSLRPVIVLVAICVVAGVLLGGVHRLTAPVIAAAEERRAEETYAALVPEADSFEEVPCEAQGCVAALRALDATGERLGVVIVAEAKGYGGDVPLAVAFRNHTLRAKAMIIKWILSNVPRTGNLFHRTAYIL